MKTTKITIAGWQDRLDSRWKSLPVKRQRKYTRILFMAYLCLTAGILAQYCAQAGQAQPMVIRHIDNKGVTTAAEKQGNHQSIKKQAYENR
jgi:hypothetical protein